MNISASDGREGLLQWSEPVIFDRLREAYAQFGKDRDTSWKLARLHAKVWRALISGEMDKFGALRTELEAELATESLTLDCLAEADSQTMDELLEIVISRFRRSQRLSEGYHRALLDMAMRLTQSRAA